MTAARAAVLLALLAAGCCREAGRCPQNAVAVYVFAGESSVADVEVVGASTEWSCEDNGGSTVCAPDTIAPGEYELEVRVGGAVAAEVTLAARVYAPPPYSCDCRIPRGEVEVELAPSSPPPDEDAGVTADAG